MKLQPVRGTRDLSGEEILYQNRVVEAAKKVAKYYSYEELATPIFEFSEVFHRTMGETSDVISKETYTFTDRDKTSITLRPEFTAGVVRSFISSGLTQSVPVKFFSYGPIFRHERPQKCRYRQFSQINFEYLGARGAYSDVEMILLASQLLEVVGLKDDIALEINSLGDVESRNKFKEKLISYLSKYKNDLSEDSRYRLDKNPLRILDSKDEEDRRILIDAPKMGDSLTESARIYYATIKDQLNYVGIEFVENPKLVRGLDYYTHTVFEFTTQLLGSQGTVLAGGRYDGLVEIMGGPATPAIGFAAGVDRLAELMREKSISLAPARKISLIPIGAEAQRFSVKLAQQLRQKAICVDNEMYDGVAKMMKRANKIGAKYAVIFGADELNQKVAKVKDMATGEERNVQFTDLVNDSEKLLA